MNALLQLADSIRSTTPSLSREDALIAAEKEMRRAAGASADLVSASAERLMSAHGVDPASAFTMASRSLVAARAAAAPLLQRREAERHARLQLRDEHRIAFGLPGEPHVPAVVPPSEPVQMAMPRLSREEAYGQQLADQQRSREAQYESSLGARARFAAQFSEAPVPDVARALMAREGLSLTDATERAYAAVTSTEAKAKAEQQRLMSDGRPAQVVACVHGVSWLPR